MRPALPVNVALTVAVVAASLLAGCAQQSHEAAWPDLVTARQQDAIDRGWVPEFLPEDATDVRMRIDTGDDSVVVLAVLPGDVALPACDGASDTPVPGAPEWFPADLDQARSCGDGWHAARTARQVALWHVPAPEPTSSPS